MGFVTAKDRPFTSGSFAQFIPEADGRELSRAVVNCNAPEPLQTLLEKLFDRQSIAVGEMERADEDRDTVYLVDGDRVVARSPLEEVSDAILMVNSDLFITGRERSTT